MLTYRVGKTGDTLDAGRMADHLMNQTLPTEQADIAAQYLHGGVNPSRGFTTPELRSDMDPSVAERLGIDQSATLTRAEVAHLLSGDRADGKPVEGKSTRQASEKSDRNGYIDFCFSADKSVSLAWAFAPTEAERSIIMQAHRDAVDATMKFIEKEMAFARKGDGGSKGADKGRWGWVKFDHYTSKPTLKIVKDEDGNDKLVLSADNEWRSGKDRMVELKIAGDPQLHTHVAVLNMVLTEDGRVGALDLQQLRGRVKEFGGIYQAFMATNLRRSGIDVALDEKKGSAKITAIPERAREGYSNRTNDAHKVAREYAVNLGADWDNMTEKARIKLLKTGATASRTATEDDVADMDAWRATAKALKWEHKSVIRKVTKTKELSREDRLMKAYERSMPYLEDQFTRRSVLDATEARIAATRGLIAHGIESGDEVSAVTALQREHGVNQEGRKTELVWGRKADEKGQKKWHITTGLHVAQEKELIRLAADAAQDKSLSLTHDEIEAAVARSGLDFVSDEHKRNQRRLMEEIGVRGKMAVGIGVAGSGKSTLLRPLVDAWSVKGYRVYGATIAWKQSEAFKDAGVAAENRMAIDAFIHRVNQSTIKPDASTILVIDELGQVGTKKLLALVRLQQKYGFKLVAVGDDKQCQSIEAGPVIELMRKALGEDQVPELLTTIRQELERDRDTSLLFREGKAAEALARKHEDGTIILEEGGHRDTVLRVVTLWDERRKANVDTPNFSITVSAPTNDDARAISAELREILKKSGEVGPDLVEIDAQDQHGTAYRMKLAVGDKVRLFDRVNGSFGKHGGNVGSNGSVLEILAVDESTVTFRSEEGNAARVKWNTLRDEDTKKVRLAYGYAGTIDSQQGITSTEHIDALPGGTQTVQGFKAYVAESRHRRKAWMVVSEGLERQEIIDRRPIGESRVVETKDLWENMAKNLSRQPTKNAAVDFLDTADDLRRTAKHGKQEGLQRKEQREADGLKPTTFAQTIRRRQEREAAAQVVEKVGKLVEELGKVSDVLSQSEEEHKHLRDVIEDMDQYVAEVTHEELRRAMGIAEDDELPPPPDWDDEAPAPQQAKPAPTERRAATWANADYDQPVVFVAVAAEKGPDGRDYAEVELDGQRSYVPLDELVFGEEEQAKPAPAPKVNQKPSKKSALPSLHSLTKDELYSLAAELRAETTLSSFITSQGVALKRDGHGFVGCCPFHDEKTASFNVDDKKAVYHCFGCGAGGDIYTFHKEYLNVGFYDAIRNLGGEGRLLAPITPRQPTPAVEEKPLWRAVFPVPAGVPPLFAGRGWTTRLYNPKRAGTDREWTKFKPQHVASYQDVDGQQIGFVLRQERPGENGGKARKITPQVTWIVPFDTPKDADMVKAGRWGLWSMGEPRSLYHAEKLAQLPDAPVIVVTGEKKADALQKTMGEAAVVVSWAGGDSARDTVDFTPLAARDVTVWPDADLPGLMSAFGAVAQNGDLAVGSCELIGKAGAAKVSVVIPPKDAPKGWDCGNFVEQGGGLEAVYDFLEMHVEGYDKDRHRALEKQREARKVEQVRKQDRERERDRDNSLSL